MKMNEKTMFAYLIHLSANMWGDPDSGKRTRFAPYYPELPTSDEVWKATVEGAVETTAAGEENAEQFMEVTLTFLFNADNGKFLGIRTEDEGLMDLLFLDGLEVSVPEGPVTEATEDEVTAVLISILFSGMGSLS